MPSVSEGLETPANDPNTDAGFAAALESRGVPGDADPSPSTSWREGLTTEPDGPPRGPDGRFASRPDTPADPPADTSATVTSDDPLVADYLAKHGGDLEAAVKAAAHQEALIGRQGQELGQTREELAELRGRLDQLSQMQTAAPAGPALTLESASEIAAQQGYGNIAIRVANEGFERGDESVYDALVAEWALTDPINAQRFDMDFQLWKREQNAQPVQQQQEDPRLAQVMQLAAVNELTNDIALVAEEYGGKEAFAPIGQHFMEALESMPPNVAAMIDSTDAEARQAGVRIVADRAARLAAAAGSGTTPAPSAVSVAAVERKLGARVAQSTGRPVATPQGAPQNREEAIAKFKADVFGAETTSVRDGLTYGEARPGFAR